ncbi:hypothetical protein [Helicobacter mesocricetorum]|uniref:hypothetical protein n=1 Tax=Helicobacter mesocricetorum TaxID=87012 RepID=UPI000CF09804|nr:hypothetical protein [Helicobacter mesocricetorum]
MLILNHFLIKPLEIVLIESKEDIQNSLPTDFLVLEENLELAKFCLESGVEYASIITDITKALLLVNLGVKFLMARDLEMAKDLQHLAETYLFDSKILLVITKDEEIKEAAKQGIDGVIFWKL